MIGHGLDRGGPVTWEGHDGFAAAGDPVDPLGHQRDRRLRDAGRQTRRSRPSSTRARRRTRRRRSYGDSGGAGLREERAGRLGARGDPVRDRRLRGPALRLRALRQRHLRHRSRELSRPDHRDGAARVQRRSRERRRRTRRLSGRSRLQQRRRPLGGGRLQRRARQRRRRAGRLRGRPGLPQSSGMGCARIPACDNGCDDDGDRLVDGADPECAASPAWWTDEGAPYRHAAAVSASSSSW